MKYLDEYRDGPRRTIRPRDPDYQRPWTIMEVCGGQTHAIVKFGIDELLPKFINLIHGPGCPVCVTPLELINKALRSPPGRTSFFAPLATCCACRAARRTCRASRPRAATCAWSIRRSTP